MTRNIKYICKTCGSDEITFDATAEWDVELQKLVVSNTYDDCYCNSEECQGEVRDAQTHDAETGEALGRAPGSFEYIPIEQADASWDVVRRQRDAENKERDRTLQQERTIVEISTALVAADEEMGL